MKNLVIVIAILICFVPSLMGACVTLKQGTILYSAGHYLAPQPIKPGYDVFGYNYQAHMFNGTYANVYLGRDGLPPYDGDDDAYLAANPAAASHWAWPYRTTNVTMKWNEAWLSNMDCDGDLKLDRHLGYTTYIGSGAWETNHMSDTYTLDPDPKLIHWTYFVKIVAAPADATVDVPVWPDTGEQTYYLGGTEMGKQIWGEFAIIQEVYNDPGAGIHGVQYKSPASPGFGTYQP